MAKLINVNNFNQAKSFLKSINVSSQGIDCMYKKMFNLNILLSNLNPAEANIIKQEALTIGADTAVAKNVAEGTNKTSNAIIMGSLRQIKNLCKRLEWHKNHNFVKINSNIKKLLQNYENNFKYKLEFKHKTLMLDELKIMGIVNVTPDSFSDGGTLKTVNDAVNKCLTFVSQNASIIDIGGETTKPGSKEVDANTEIQRITPVIKALREKSDCIISIDTKKAEVAKQAIIAGANIINDVSSMGDKNMIDVLKQYDDVKIVLMHMQGKPENMQNNPKYDDVLNDVYTFFENKLEFCLKNGINLNRIIIDPGIGFGKNQSDNLQLISNLNYFNSLNVPVLLGASKKSFIGNIYKSTPQQRLEGSLATTAAAYKNKANIVRVHDVLQHYNFLQVLKQVL